MPRQALLFRLVLSIHSDKTTIIAENLPRACRAHHAVDMGLRYFVGAVASIFHSRMFAVSEVLKRWTELTGAEAALSIYSITPYLSHRHLILEVGNTKG